MAVQHQRYLVSIESDGLAQLADVHFFLHTVLLALLHTIHRTEAAAFPEARSLPDFVNFLCDIQVIILYDPAADKAVIVV